ncbi:Sec62/63 complex, subunit Sec66 [Emericellopsis atlantica]|uniref:Sec62/63 complex, subunit Sec66 n=1 Tax=Emericellopsis atlantica TaxID=2614577 RepID=A0A9P7ZP27_9HYPO|nr:Sec62/63 complex, subunit Sec66 [Emericellopsis atlantica]KAG9255110.1 Sec62/63 complex, subunit Sec66 [Emericellopsis atlantica]
MFDVDWKGLALPFAYLAVLGGALATFSTIYRKRKAARSANLEPWFGPHVSRDIYLTLLHMLPEDPKDEKATKIPVTMVRAALLRRAIEDLQRLVQIRSAKQACSSLLQRGSVGDDLWQRFQRAESEMQAELQDVVREANALSPQWGQIIFQSANEILLNDRMKEQIDEIQDTVESEKAWWAKRKEEIGSELIKELDESEKSSTTDEAVLVDTPEKKKKVAAKA